MDSTNTRCIVLRTIKYGDNSIIADLLTREWGRLSVAVKVGAGGNGRRRRLMFQPLNILEITCKRRQGKQLTLVTEERMAEAYTSLPFNGIKMSIAFFAAEFLLHATRDIQADEPLFDFIENSLLWLDTADHGVANFHLMLMLHLSKFIGFYPDTESYAVGYGFDLREGRFCSHAPIHRDYLQPQDAEKILQLMRMSAHNMHLFRMTRAERNRITDTILHFYRLHIPAFPELRSLDILREL